MKYQIEVDVANAPDVDVAALTGVLSYILSSSIKQVPGVASVSIQSIETVVETQPEPIPTEPDPKPSIEEPPPVEEAPTDPSTEEQSVEEPPVESPSTE